LTKASVQPKAIGSPDPCGTGYRGKIAREICDNLIAAELFNEITFLDNSTAFQDFYKFFFEKIYLTNRLEFDRKNKVWRNLEHEKKAVF